MKIITTLFALFFTFMVFASANNDCDNDTESPQIIIKNITVEAGFEGEDKVSSKYLDNGTVDNCTTSDKLVFSPEYFNFTCSDLGENNVTIYVKDESGNIATKNAIITVVDHTPAYIEFHKKIEIKSEGNYTVPDFTKNLQVTDNCGVNSIEQYPEAGTVLEQGEYEILFTVTDVNGNVSTFITDLYIEDTSMSTQNININKHTSFYPNPVVDVLTLGVSAGTNLNAIHIFNIKGVLMHTAKLHNNSVGKEKISMQNLPKGAYFVKVYSSKGVFFKRVIKK